MNLQIQPSIELIVGRAGSGKTTACISRFVTDLTSHGTGLESQSVFLVPTSEHADRIRSVMLQDQGNAGFFNMTIMTLDACMQDVLSRIARVPSVSPLQKHAILKDIVQILSERQYFSALADPDDFAAALARIIADIKVQGHTVADLDAVYAHIKQEHVCLGYKVADIAAVFTAYQSFLRAHDLCDKEDVLMRYVRQKEPSETRMYDAVYVDGFFDFSEYQLAFLKQFAQNINSMVITLTTDTAQHAQELFALSNKTITSLQDIFPFLKIIQQDACQRGYSTTLLHMESQIFRSENRTTMSADPQSLCVMQAKHASDEIVCVADTIRRLVLHEGYAYYDIAVIFRYCDPYAQQIRQVFAAYDMPFELHERRRMNQNPAIKAIMGYMRMYMTQGAIADVITHLKSSYVQYGDIDVSGFEQYVVEHGLQSDGAVLGTICEDEDLGDDLRSVLVQIVEGLGVCNDEESVTYWNEYFKSRIFSSTFLSADVAVDWPKDDLRALTRMDDIFDEMAETYVMQVTGARYCELLYKMFDVSLYSVSEENLNAVQIYNVGNVKQKEYKVCFVCGLSDGVFPRVITEDIVLKDDERRLITQAGIALPTYREHVHSEKYMFYVAITRAIERLYLVYPGFDMQGRELPKSGYVDEVIRCFDDVAFFARHKTDLFSDADTIMHKDTLKKKLVFDCANKDFNIVNHRILHDFSCDIRALVSTEDAGEEVLRDERIHAILRDEKKALSATKIETYAQCPYRFFLEKLVKLDVRDEFFDARQRGTVIHEALDRFYTECFADCAGVQKQAWLLLRDTAQAKERMKVIFAEVIQEADIRAEHLPAVEAAIMQACAGVLRLLDAEYAIEQERATVPYVFEYSFGLGQDDGSPEHFYLKYDDGFVIPFCGVIDRVDRMPDEQVSMVIDYKGAKTINKKDMEEGREVQLFLYRQFVRDVLGFDIAGMELFSYKTGTRDGVYAEELYEKVGLTKKTAKRYAKDDFARFEDAFKRHVRGCVERLRAADIRLMPKKCDFCNMGQVCRYEKWRLKADKAGSDGKE